MPNTNSYDIDECLSKLYLVTLENFDTYKSSPNQPGWLFLALKNISSDYRREKKKDDKPGSDSLEENEYRLADNFSEDEYTTANCSNTFKK